MDQVLPSSLVGVLDTGLRLAGVCGISFALYCLTKFQRALATNVDGLTRAAPKLTDEFKGKVVWITGASSGIGREAAFQLSRQGAKLILSSRREEALVKVKEEILADAGCKTDAKDIQIVQLDLEQLETLDDKAKEALGLYGYVDVLFNNGGISTRAMGRDSSFDVDMKLMKVDFLSYVILARACIPSMTKQGGGLFINISSAAGKLGTPLRTAYCASKFAVLGWFDALRAEETALGSGIRVTNVCPGSVKTNVSKNSISADGSSFGKMDPNIGGGLSAEFAVERMLAAAHAGVYEVWVAPKPEMIGLYGMQCFPAWMMKQICNGAKKKMADTLKCD